ncbi:MAG: acyl-CoA dehydrogenase, partial [Chitinophagaceae bacterium]
MTPITETKTVLKGAEWLIKESIAIDCFSPENFGEEHLMIRDMCNQFLENEVNPILDRIDSLEPGLMKSLVTKAG